MTARLRLVTRDRGAFRGRAVPFDHAAFRGRAVRRAVDTWNFVRWPGRIVLCAAVACAPGTPKEADWPTAGILLAPATRPGDFLDRQRIVATYKGHTASFDAVVQKKGNELTLVGLTPFGSRAFVLRQVGGEASFESFVPQTLPFPPNYILVDVERVFFPWTDAAPPTEAIRQFSHDGEIVTERWQAGRLLRRTFSRDGTSPALPERGRNDERTSPASPERGRNASSPSPGQIVVDYDGGMASDGTPPPHVSFDNGQFGYHLDITTLIHQNLSR